jgi:DNA-binding IclR family transcriptional regulator
LFRDGHAYFQGVWAQAESDASPGQPAILSALSRSEDGMTSGELAQATRLSLDEVRRGLDILKQHDVVAEQDDSWRFTVELMRRWVAQTHRPS